MKTALFILTLCGFHQIYVHTQGILQPDEQEKYNIYLFDTDEPFPYMNLQKWTPLEEEAKSVRLGMIPLTEKLVNFYTWESIYGYQERLQDDDLCNTPLHEKELTELTKLVLEKGFAIPETLPGWQGMLFESYDVLNKMNVQNEQARRSAGWFTFLLNRLVNRLESLNRDALKGLDIERQLEQISNIIMASVAKSKEQTSTTGPISPISTGQVSPTSTDASSRASSSSQLRAAPTPKPRTSLATKPAASTTTGYAAESTQTIETQKAALTQPTRLGFSYLEPNALQIFTTGDGEEKSDNILPSRIVSAQAARMQLPIQQKAVQKPILLPKPSKTPNNLRQKPFF